MTKRVILSIPLQLFLSLLWSGACLAQNHRVYDLRVDGVSKPMGVCAQKLSFSWKMESDTRNARQTAWEIQLVQTCFLDDSSHSLWTSGKMHGNQTIGIPYQGPALLTGKTYFWRVRIWNENNEISPWSDWSEFTTALSYSDWEPARWLQMEATQRVVVPGLHLNSEAKKFLGDEKTGMYRMPLFRKVTVLNKPVRRATIAISGLGQFELFINGEKVGHNFLDPGWTAYDKEILYVMEDVTSLLKRGKNVLGVMLGGGFFNIPRERYFKLLTTYGAPRLKAKLIIEYTDGSTSEIVTDKSWRTAPSPITYSSIYGGEDFDANLIQPGWNSDPDFNDNNWNKPILVDCKVPLRAQTAGRVAVNQRLAPVRRYKNAAGRWIYDFGQNMSGIVALKVRGNCGASVRLFPAELLNIDSTANQNATGSPYYFQYKLNGNDIESWHPQFTYYGFRYVEIDGAVPMGECNPDSLPEIIAIDALHTSTDCRSVGRFTCSKPLFNQIFNLIDWASRSNMASITTDCPTREKLGWQEQNNLMQQSLMYLYDLQPLFNKIVRDMAHAQHDNGAVPTICPEYTRFAGGFEDSPEWGASFIICPWNIFKWYGDKTAIQDYYPSMVRYMDYLVGKSDNLILSYGLGDWFDIGPKNPGKSQLTSLGVTSTAYMQYEASLLAKMADLLGKTDDSLKYKQLAEEIRKNFIKKYFNPSDSTFDRNSQTTNALIAFFNLADDDAMRQTAINNLVRDIQNRGNALTAGDVGYRYVLQALASAERSDVIFDMNSRYDTFGYGWQLAQGATALTESWQALPSVSNNHLMLGHLMEWFCSYLGGIRQSDSSLAWNEIIIAPQPVGDVTEADTEFESPRGTIRCHWCLSPNGNFMKVTIPANTSASVLIPGSDVVKNIGSGNYTFEF